MGRRGTVSQFPPPFVPLYSLLPFEHHPCNAIAFARQVADVLHGLDVVRRDTQLLAQISAHSSCASTPAT